MLDKDNQHLFLEDEETDGGSFIANVNKIVDNLIPLQELNDKLTPEEIDNLLDLADNVNKVGGNLPVVATGATEARKLSDRFSDIVNVKDFGAKGDGIHDDTEAFRLAKETAKDCIIFIPNGKYKITSEVTGNFISTNIVSFVGEGKISSVIPINHLKKGLYNGQAESIHVNHLKGNDFNDGKTADTAVKTLERAFQLWNIYKSPQTNIYLYGNSVYETPALTVDFDNGNVEGLPIIANGAPHIIGVENNPGEGYPTLKFIFCVTGVTTESVVRTSRHYVYGYNTQSTGPRIYTAHPNFKNITIDSNYNGIYFEGCSISFNDVIFKIPCRIIGSTGTLLRCSFTGSAIIKNDKSYNPWGSSSCSALYCYNSTLRITDSTLNLDDATNGFTIHDSSSISLTGTNTVVKNSLLDKNGYLVSIDSSMLRIVNTDIINTNENLLYSLYATGNSQILFNNSDQFTLWRNTGDGIQFAKNCVIFNNGMIITSELATTLRETDTIFIHTGTSAASGGGVWMYGKKHSTSAGKVRVQSYTDTNGYVYIEADSSTNAIRINRDLVPSTTNERSLGIPSCTWQHIYSSTGAVEVSDRNYKTFINDVDESLMKAWSKVDFKSFKFVDAVEKKGEDARVHFGIIAQQVKEAFESEGLDASKYALFCYDEWNDEYKNVEIIDVEAVYDENGNEISPAVTHIEQKLITPAGSRYGIRYSEALALEVSYQRWLGKQRDKEIAELKAMLVNSKPTGYILS